jgi:hypothetical protein
MHTSNLLEVSEKTKTVLPNRRSKMGGLGVMLAMFSGSAVWALDAPQGPVVLKVSGLIEAHNQGKVAVLDMKALQALPQKSFTTQSDAREHDVVVAVQMNGQAIPVRTKGPLFIVYPFDAKKELQQKIYYERSIWQLKAIEVE